MRIATLFPESDGRRFSVLVESLTAGVPIVVESSQYQSSGEFGAGGAALATRIQP
jgi:hypothetical protein